MSAPSEPIRPAIPLILWAATALAAGPWVAESLTWRASQGFAVGAGDVLCVLLATCFVWAAGRSHTLRVLAAALLMGAAVGGLHWFGVDAGSQKVAREGARYWDCTVTSDPVFSNDGWSVRARISGTPRVMVELAGKGTSAPLLGSRVRVFGAVVGAADPSIVRRARRAGLSGRLRVRTCEQYALTQTPGDTVWVARRRALDSIRASDVTAAPLLQGVLLGDRSALAGSDADLDFKTCGLSHLVAVSGSHLVVVAALVSWLLARMRVSTRTRDAVVIGVLGVYVLATGAQPSAVRSAVMCAVYLLAHVAGRRSDGLASLGAALSCLVLWSPSAVFDVGFQLSVVAVGGLLVFARFVECWLHAAALPGGESWASPLAMTLVAQVVTTPITVPVFGVVSVIAPIANLFAAPLVAAIMVLGLLGVVAAMIGVGWIGTPLLWTSGQLARLLVRLAGFAAAVPRAALPVGGNGLLLALAGVLAGATLWWAWPRPRTKASRWLLGLATAGLFGFVLWPGGVPRMSIEVLDVGQGDALLVRGKTDTLLVDTGPSVRSLRAALGRWSVREIDLIVITHLHADHIGGLAGLRGMGRPGAVLVPLGTCASGWDDKTVRSLCATVAEVCAGDRVDLGGMSVRVVSPAPGAGAPGENDGSIVLEVSDGRTKVLLTGDAESAVLERLERDGAIAREDVLKVGHHGSSGAVSGASLALMRPAVAVISVGADNSFGHPRPDTLSLLSDAGAAIARTDECGDVSIRFTTRGARVLAQRARKVDGRHANRATTSDPCAKLGLHAPALVSGAVHVGRSARSQACLSHNERARIARRRGARAPPCPRGPS